MNHTSAQGGQPSTQPKDAPDTEKPFDPDTLPPHLRAVLDQLSEIRYDAMVLIAEARADERAQAQRRDQAGTHPAVPTDGTLS